MEKLQIIQTIIAFVVGGGLTTLCLLPFKRKKEEMSVVQDVQTTYQTMIKDLKADRELWKSKYEELQIEVNNLKQDALQRDKTIKDLQRQLKQKPKKQ